MQLTKDFTLAEMQCPCGHCNGGTMDALFMASLQRLRDKCNFPFLIDSGYRCHEHNADPKVGGKPDSLHLSGRAADIYAPAYGMREKIKRYASSCGLQGIGIGPNFVHVDNREHPACWTYPIKK